MNLDELTPQDWEDLRFGVWASAFLVMFVTPGLPPPEDLALIRTMSQQGAQAAASDRPSPMCHALFADLDANFKAIGQRFVDDPRDTVDKLEAAVTVLDRAPESDRLLYATVAYSLLNRLVETAVQRQPADGRAEATRAGAQTLELVAKAFNIVV